MCARARTELTQEIQSISFVRSFVHIQPMMERRNFMKKCRIQQDNKTDRVKMLLSDETFIIGRLGGVGHRGGREYADRSTT